MHILFVGKVCPTNTANTIMRKTGKNPGFQIIKFDTRGLIVYYAVEILITQAELNIQPILSFPFFFQDLINSQPHSKAPFYLMYKLYTNIMLDK